MWDEPHFKPVFASIFWQHRLPGNPVNTEVKGGHSDAFDWDRHLAHVSNIYDMLLPYILSGGRLSEDHLGIRESGNGIPDIIDEARNEVDFFLSIRDGEAYSQGVTNPSEDWSVMFQAGCTTMAAWANAANCAIIGEAFRLQGNDSLCQYYTDEAIKAFFFASRQENMQLDDRQDIGSMQLRGRDFRQMAAAYLYNLTGDQQWEKIFAEEAYELSIANTWIAAAYLTCPQPRHFAERYQQILASVDKLAESYNIANMSQRPSRRSANDRRWQVSQNLQLVMLAHYIAKDKARKKELEHVMYTEASWAMGRNPGNIVEMTGLGERHITDFIEGEAASKTAPVKNSLKHRHILSGLFYVIQDYGKKRQHRYSAFHERLQEHVNTVYVFKDTFCRPGDKHRKQCSESTQQRSILK